MSQNLAALDAEFFSRPGAYVQRTIPAGENVMVDAYGASFFVISTSGNAPLWISPGDATPLPYSAGTGADFPRYFRFNVLQIENRGPSDILVNLWYGFGKYVDNRTFYTATPVELVGVDIGGQFAPSTSYVLTGVPTSLNYVSRKSVIITNNDTTNRLQLIDGAGVISGFVPPASIIEIETQKHLTVRNDSGTPISGALSEQWNYIP